MSNHMPEVAKLKTGMRCETREGSILIVLAETEFGILFWHMNSPRTRIDCATTIHESLYKSDLTAIGKHNGHADIMAIYESPQRGPLIMDNTRRGKLIWKRESCYTIPEDLPVDSKVWVMDEWETFGGETEKGWVPRHFCAINNRDNEYPYSTFAYGLTSFTIDEKGMNNDERLEGWTECITDEDYQRRKKEGTL